MEGEELTKGHRYLIKLKSLSPFAKKIFQIWVNDPLTLFNQISMFCLLSDFMLIIKTSFKLFKPSNDNLYLANFRLLAAHLNYITYSLSQLSLFIVRWWDKRRQTSQNVRKGVKLAHLRNSQHIKWVRGRES